MGESVCVFGGDVGAYPIYSFTYTKKLSKNHIYYFRFNYKFSTTNQNPTWVALYADGGASRFSGELRNPVANTEYTISGYQYANSKYNINNATIYNGDSNAINGVTGYIKNCMCYDVTYLYDVLRGLGIVTNETQLVTWCDTNLLYKQVNVKYDIRTLISDITNIKMKGGSIMSEIIECDGMQKYSINTNIRQHTYFDNGSGLDIYNNNGNGVVSHSRVSAKDQGSPFYPEHPYVLKIVTNGSANPSCGGFIANHVSAANKIFVEKFVAKVPTGYTVTAAYNSQGDGNTVSFLSNNRGTGEWEEYTILYKCGTGGTFSTGGHVYLVPDSGYSSTSVTWYLAYANNCDITGNEELKNYTALPNKDRMKGNKTFSYEFETGNYFPNGQCTDTGMTLPNGWTYDTTDVAGNGKASIVQPVGGVNGTVGGPIKVEPNTRYKVSFWVKCKGDMSSFLTAIHPYTANGVAMTHANVVWVTGTRTTLSADLVSGATQMTVASNANWVAKSYSSVGFRNTWYGPSYNNVGTFSNGSTGTVKGVSGSNIVTFNVAYKGSTIPKGTYVVETFDGGNYPYPIQKHQLPTDNTWRYVEGYFGSDNSAWMGNGDGWVALPADTDYIYLALNIYSNNGTVPIKYCDIKIQQVGTYGDGEKSENKIQFKKHS